MGGQIEREPLRIIPKFLTHAARCTELSLAKMGPFRGGAGLQGKTGVSVSDMLSKRCLLDNRMEIHVGSGYMSLKFSRGVSSKASISFKLWGFMYGHSIRSVPGVIAIDKPSVYGCIANPSFCVKCQVKFRSDWDLNNFIDILCNGGHLFN